MDYKLIVKVLSYLLNHHPVKLTNFLIDKGTGFSSLEKKGLISIKKVEGEYIASLTDKGFEVITF
jgi:hypothetical protein